MSGADERRLLTGPSGDRTAMSRASDARPFKPYVYGGETEEPPAVTAMRERYRAHQAELDRLAALDACEDCGYLTTAPGHAICCGGAP